MGKNNMQDYPWAVNRTKLNIAITRANNTVALARAANPGKEIPDASEEDVKNEYVKLAGLLYTDEAADKLDEQARDAGKGASFVAAGAKKFREKVEVVKAKKSK